jgi:hypothetical protein
MPANTKTPGWAAGRRAKIRNQAHKTTHLQASHTDPLTKVCKRAVFLLTTKYSTLIVKIFDAATVPKIYNDHIYHTLAIWHYGCCIIS